MIIAHSYYTRCKAVRKCITIHLNMSCVCVLVCERIFSLSHFRVLVHSVANQLNSARIYICANRLYYWS